MVGNERPVSGLGEAWLVLNHGFLVVNLRFLLSDRLLSRASPLPQ